MSSPSSTASSTVPIKASSSNTMGLPSLDMTSNYLFQYYMESFFKIPKDIKNDIIYCQRAMKAHIKVHQMVLDVYNQQPDADPVQKKLILDELENEIYEINAEQNFLFLRLRRIIDEFLKMLKKNDIFADTDATNGFISKEIVPLINNSNLEILPITVSFRNNEEKLIEKYFEVQKELTTPEMHFCDNVEIIDLDDEDGTVVEEKVFKAHGKQRGGNRKDQLGNAISSANSESLLKSLNSQMAQPSLLKPMNQRMANDLMSVDGQPKIMKPTTTLGDIYKQKKEKEKPIELPVSTNVKMSRMNLRQALKRAQAAVRGPTANVSIPPPPPPPAPPASTSVSSASSSSSANSNNTEAVGKKNASTKTRNTRAAVAAAAAAAATISGTSRKSPAASSSSEGGTPERGNTPPHNYWPDEFEETRTKSEEYGQEMFLRLFDLFTPEIHAQLQQRRSKRRRRCVQNNNYHYGRIEQHPTSSLYESENKKKRKAFLLSPQVKKALPAKRTKRRSRDNASETNSVPPSRSNSSSPDEKRSCNECLKGRNNLEQCEECKFYYHPQCHREEDDAMIGEDPKKNLNEMKKCPGCKRKQDKIVKEGILLNKNLQRCAQELELQYAKEKDRHEILQRTSKSYKIQMNNLYEIVNSIKSSESTSSTSATTAADKAAENMICENDDVIHLD